MRRWGTTARFQDAYDGFVKLQKMQPKNHELFVAAGQALQSMGKAEGALEEYKRALSVIGPKVSSAHSSCEFFFHECACKAGVPVLNIVQPD